MTCRCALGPAEPDQGWCSAVQLVEVERGTVDDVELGGARFAVALELPGDFFSGVDKARLYFDEATTTEQQRNALTAVYTGERGGVWGELSQMVQQWLPPKVLPIDIQTEGEEVRASLDGAGEIRLTWLKTPDGKQAKLLNAPVVAAFGVDELDLASAEGSAWRDPDMRGWESLGNGGRIAFAWTG